VYASARVVQTLRHTGRSLARNESEGWPGQPRWEAVFPLVGSTAAPSTDLEVPPKGLSESIPVGTRKMVNYACIGGDSEAQVASRGFSPLVNKRERYSCQHTASSGGLTPAGVLQVEPSGPGSGRHTLVAGPKPGLEVRGET